MPTCEVREWVDVFYIQQCVLAVAAEIGFSRRESNELAIVATELCSNILKYGVLGSLDIDRIEDELGIGLSLVASDRGPPFKDFEAALRDGWDDRGPIDPLEMLKRRGIGGGLGAVQRLSHSLRVEIVPTGKRVHAMRYLARGIRGWTQK